MQGTVRTFDTRTHGGDVILDDGSVVTYDHVAFDASGLRFLRPGQRVRLVVGSSGAVELVTLVTLRT